MHHHEALGGCELGAAEQVVDKSIPRVASPIALAPVPHLAIMVHEGEGSHVAFGAVPRLLGHIPRILQSL